MQDGKCVPSNVKIVKIPRSTVIILLNCFIVLPPGFNLFTPKMLLIYGLVDPIAMVLALAASIKLMFFDDSDIAILPRLIGEDGLVCSNSCRVSIGLFNQHGRYGYRGTTVAR